MNKSNPAPASTVGIAFDMTHTQALVLAEDIFMLADSLRDDLATGGEIPKETHRLLLGALGLIAHAANNLSEFAERLEAQRGAHHE